MTSSNVNPSFSCPKAMGLVPGTALEDIHKGLVSVAHAMLRESCPELTFLVAGKSGVHVGKSTLINSLVGRKVCEIDWRCACATETRPIKVDKIKCIGVGVYDMPGTTIHVLAGDDDEVN